MTIDVTTAGGIETMTGKGFTLTGEQIGNIGQAFMTRLTEQYPTGVVPLNELLGLAGSEVSKELGWTIPEMTVAIVSNPDFNYVVCVIAQTCIQVLEGEVPPQLMQMKYTFLDGRMPGGGVSWS